MLTWHDLAALQVWYPLWRLLLQQVLLPAHHWLQWAAVVCGAVAVG